MRKTSISEQKKSHFTSKNKTFNLQKSVNKKSLFEKNSELKNQDLKTEYILGSNEKTHIVRQLNEKQNNIKSQEMSGNENGELIDIVFVDEEPESEPKSELSKITEVEYSYKQLSQDKQTNSFLNSNFENDKYNDHRNHTSKKSSVEIKPCPILRGSTNILQASSKSINLTKSNNISVIENLNYSLEEQKPNSPPMMKRVTRIKLKQMEHKSKSRSLDIQCINHLRTSQEEDKKNAV